MAITYTVDAQETATYNRGNSNYFHRGGSQIRYASGTFNFNAAASGKIVTGLSYIYAYKIFNLVSGAKDPASAPNQDGAAGVENGSIGINAVTTNTDTGVWYAIGRA